MAPLHSHTQRVSGQPTVCASLGSNIACDRLYDYEQWGVVIDWPSADRFPFESIHESCCPSLLTQASIQCEGLFIACT